MTQASRDHFSVNANQWDVLQSTFFSQQVSEKAICKAYLRPEMWIANVGAESGFLSAALAKLVERVYLMDASPGRLAVARKNLAAFDNVKFYQAEGLTVPLPGGSLDVVFANFVFSQYPDPLAAIQEMARILKPGGRVVIIDLQGRHNTPVQAELPGVSQGFESTQVLHWLQQAGLVNTLVECNTENYTAPGTSLPLQVEVLVAVGSQPVSGVRKAVQENYAAVARAAGSCCTPPSNSRQPGKSLDQDNFSESATGTYQAGSNTAANTQLPADAEVSTPLVSCCSPTSPLIQLDEMASFHFETGYQPEQSAGLPQEATSFALGCGNPTALADLRPGEVVVDIGSGGGLDAMLAARQVGKAGRVIGVDMTPEMLERARAAVKKVGLTNVQFRQGQAEALPVEGKSVDVILSNCVINLSEDKGRVFQEAYRVLKPGGRMEISDMVADGSFPWAWRSDPNNWGGCVFGALPEGEYLDLICQAGFEAIEIRQRAPSGQAAGVKLSSITLRAVKPRLE